MEKTIRKFLSVVLATSLLATCFAATIFAAAPSVGVSYSAHVQDNGWMTAVSDGALAGTTGQSKRTEALKINLTNAPAGAHINYQVQVQDYGWMPVVSDGAIAGTEGQSKRLEAIKMTITGVTGYTVEYRVHVQDYGWMDWVSDGSIAGTVGQSKRMEAIQIRLVANVNSISITPEMSLIAGGSTGTITTTVDPAREVNNIVWSSDKTAVATVSNGVVTPVTVGTATITASVGGKTAACMVSVQSGGSHITSIVVSAVNITGNAVAGQTLTATPNPSNATVSYQWMSCDTSTGTFTNITGATSPLYVVTGGDTGKYIKVTVSGTGGFTGTQTSEATAEVLADMTAYNAALAAVSEADYTSASWADYMTVVNAHQVTGQNTQAEVDAVTQAITQAQADLIAVTANTIEIVNDVNTLGLIGITAATNDSAVATAAVNNTTGKIDITSKGQGTAIITVANALQTAAISVSVYSDGSITIMSIIPYVAPDRYEPDNSYPEAVSIAADGTFQTHTMPSGDIDWMKFDAVSGVTYKIQTSNLSSDIDTVMYLYAGDGTTFIASNDDTFINGNFIGYGSTINFTPASTGTYYVCIKGFSIYSYGQYDISITQ
jgi:uncharacterized protein YjdB